MTDSAHIQIHHVTRVEGHGDITVRIQNGALEEVRFSVVEAPRFFEAFLRDREYAEVTHLASRICGICAVSHRGAALKATEAAFGAKISDQSFLLRRLAFHGEVLSSHILHIYFLAAPDYLGVPSLLHLAKKDRDTVLRAMRLKQTAYDLCAWVVGRHTHPVAMNAGGFPFVHDTKPLGPLRERLEKGMADIRDTVSLFNSFSIPEFERETEYVSLSHPEHYALYDGDIVSSDGKQASPHQYTNFIEEYLVPYSTAKYARCNRPEYMVGALARVNNNFGQLSRFAREVADLAGITVPCFNPFMNTLAQIVECAHCLEESIQIIDQLVERDIRAEDEQAEVIPRAGRGVGAVEAPRGILFHEYAYDANGACTSANLVIPTAQNLGNLEADMRAFTPDIVHQEEAGIAHALEMLVRAYDPCISCSTHVIKTTGSTPS
ncbi:MAG: Ni/Fe hydrogenase subunit alpha [Thermodesulfobacteriota bacterium]